jgi:hypothetical protein
MLERTACRREGREEEEVSVAAALQIGFAHTANVGLTADHCGQRRSRGSLAAPPSSKLHLCRPPTSI